MKTSRVQHLLAALCGCAFLQSSLQAEEGGSGHYLPGAMSSFMDAVPPKETFIARYNMVYYNGDIAANEPLPIAGLNTLGAEATSWVHGLSLAWRPPIDMGDRWSYAFSATIPFVWMDVTANVTAGANTARRTSTLNGLGDKNLAKTQAEKLLSISGESSRSKSEWVTDSAALNEVKLTIIVREYGSRIANHLDRAIYDCSLPRPERRCYQV